MGYYDMLKQEKQMEQLQNAIQIEEFSCGGCTFWFCNHLHNAKLEAELLMLLSAVDCDGRATVVQVG
jgi:hypothetical protein